MKKLLLPAILLLCLFIPTGCIKRDTMEDITIYTTAYPIEYITSQLYGNHSVIKSIYPNGVIINQYELTDIELKEYSKNDLFIFNGLGKEKTYINKMLINNKNLKIIDSTKSMDYENGEEELWLNPSNILMLSQNIKSGLDEYINNKYLRNNISENYENLKLTISKLEAKIYLMVENADTKNIVVGNDSLKFLEKYGLTVYSLKDNTNLTDKVKETVKKKVNSGEINYIFLLNPDEKNDFITQLESTGKVKIVYLNNLSNLSEEERNNNKDYLTVMNDNMDAIRAELYNS